MEEKLLYTGNNLNVEQICGILDENGIPYEKREQGADQYLKITMGNFMFNASIYVNENELEKAQKLIENFIEKKDNFEGDENSNDSEEPINESSNANKIVAYCLIGLPIIIAIIVVIKSFV